MQRLLQDFVERFDGPVVVVNADGEPVASSLGAFAESAPAPRSFRILLESLPLLESAEDLLHVVFCLRNNSGILQLGGDFAKVFGTDLSQAPNPSASLLEIIHPADRQEVSRRIFVSPEMGFCDSQYRVLSPPGEIRWVRTVAATLIEESGTETFFASWSYCVSRTVLSSSTQSSDLRREGTARLANMPMFRQRISERLNHWISGKKPSPFAVLIVNLVRFRAVNESLGHHAGDLVLREATRWLRGELGPRDVLAGLGGAEFAILLDQVEGHRECVSRVEQLLVHLGRPFWIQGQELRLQSRAGLAFPENLQSSVDSLLRDADAALEQCRRSGERIVSSSTDGFARSSRKLVLEVDLRLAIERNEFHFVYQPVFDARNGKICMLEALLRWQHPRLGTISPSSFLQLAEDSGLVLQLDLQGLDRVTTQIQQWDRGIPDWTGVPLSLNLSGRHFTRFARQRLIEEFLDPRRLAGGRVAIELTETVFIEGAPEVVESLKSLRQLGVDIWLDDFGIGYSSLQYLALFPVTGIKVPEFFVQSCLEADHPAILRSFQQLAQGLGLGLVAEGVETPQQAQCLLELGYHWLQGYHFSHPLAANDIPALFAAQLKTRET